LFPCSYDLALEPNLDAFTFTGVVEITYRVDPTKLNEENAQEITLHAKELAFASAEYWLLDDASRAEAVRAEQIHVNLKATTVKFIFPKAIPSTATSLALKIEYTGFLNNQMAGFYRSSYTDIHGNTKIMASTQFESLDARRAFPCVDEPAAKAVFGLALTIPADRQCFSNMPESSVVTLPGGNSDGTKTRLKTRVTVSFLDTPIMSTYLLAFCVGEFDCLQAPTAHGVLVKVYTPPGKSSSGQFALDTAVRALDAYNDFFQLPYPLPKLDMVAIPEFAAGAMEVCPTSHVPMPHSSRFSFCVAHCILIVVVLVSLDRTGAS
jgi:puromycin-sensitive aminopeptidase